MPIPCPRCLDCGLPCSRCLGRGYVPADCELCGREADCCEDGLTLCAECAEARRDEMDKEDGE